jgi:hypothetical protein
MDAKKFLSRALVVAWVGIVAGVSLAQGSALTLFAPVEGDITPDSPQTWTFNAREGEVLSLFVQVPTGSTLDPILTLENANGDILLENDNYAPDRPDALLQAFTLPRTATYRATVRAFGDTAGAYRLSLLSGYASILLYDNFAAPSAVSASAPVPEAPLQVSFENGALRLRQDGILQTGFVLHDQSQSADVYANLRVRSVAHRNGWQVGLLLRQQPNGDGYAFQLNNRGQWRFVLRQNGVESTLRDWGTHPAITPEKVDFRLGVLANGRGFDVFYDGQYMSTVTDTAFAEGKVGVGITTANALNSTVVAEFDDLTLTVPAQQGERRVQAKQLLVGTANIMVRQLQRQSYIPYGGTMALEVPEARAQFASGGISRVPLARGSTFSNFAYGATVTWQAFGEGIAGCGLIAREEGEGYLLAFVESSGGHGLSLRVGDAFVQNVYHQLATPKTRYQLLIVANEERADLFLDGVWVGAIASPKLAGSIATAVTNYDRVTTECQFNDVWLWGF